MAGKRAHSPRPELSVILVNYNVREFLHHALISLQKSLRGIRAEIVVVDNASDDGSVEMLRHNFPSVHVIANETNVGFARANNQALRRVRGEFLLLLNPDTVVQEDTMRVMLEFFREHPAAGMAGCKILNPDGTFQLACRRGFPTPWVAFTKISGLSRLAPRSRLLGRYNLTYLSPDETYEIDALSGSFMMLRRGVYERIGGLDEQFFMYGEDLDWCYRVQQAGWKIYYVHSTQIIHYKGESTRRSGIDEIRTFYEAMSLFVRKHYGRSLLLSTVLRLAIAVTTWLAILRGLVRPLAVSLFDILLVDLNLLLAELVWRGQLFLFPAYAYPIVYIVPAVMVVGSLYALGVYTHRRMSVSRTMLGVFIGYVLISALVAFFKEYAFSRMVIVLSGVFSVVTLPAWRFALRVAGRTVPGGRKSLFGRRTLIVGTDQAARKLAKRLRSRVAEGYEVVGFIAASRRSVGRTLDSIPVAGSMENVGKVIQELRIGEVIFSTGELTYTDILSVIGRAGTRLVNYHLLPGSLEVIIGKGSVDSLDDLPLVQISYNIERPSHRFVKRLFDLLVSSVLLISIYPFVYWKVASGNRDSRSPFLQLPIVFTGRKSLVGPVDGAAGESGLFLGKPGLTGLVQLHRVQPVPKEDADRLNLYYARNQSFLLDVEILLKSLVQHRSARRSGIPDEQAAPPRPRGTERRPVKKG